MVPAPDVLQELGARQHPAGVAHEVRQQAELRRRQVDLGARAAYGPARLVQLQVGHAQHLVRRLGGARGTPQHRAYAGDEGVDGEGLGDVVVAAERQPGDRVRGGVPRGQEDHRRLVAAAPQAAAHLEPVEVGQHDVEHDELRAAVLGASQRLAPGAGGGHVEPVEAQRHLHQVPDVRLIVDDEHARTVHRSHHRAPGVPFRAAGGVRSVDLSCSWAPAWAPGSPGRAPSSVRRRRRRCAGCRWTPGRR